MIQPDFNIGVIFIYLFIFFFLGGGGVFVAAIVFKSFFLK